MAYWLLKSEPEEFGIDDLEQKECEMWEGVRNYQARNFMREMKQGDLAFLYHSSCKTVGIAGVMRIEKGGYPDPTAEDPSHPYFDKTQPEENRWTAVDVKFVEKFPRVFTLKEIKALAEQDDRLNDLMLVSKSRLSVMPITQGEWFSLIEAISTME